MTDKSTEFDLILRTKLQDAEMRPSRRVWKGVSHRLDADKPAKLSWHSYATWAGASISFAAAAVALFVFLTGGRQDGFIPQRRSFELAQTGQIELLPIPRSRALMADNIREISYAEAYKEQEIHIQKDASEPQPQSASKNNSPKTRTIKKTIINPFATLPEEWASVEFRRIALYAKGMIGGNEQGLNAKMAISSMAPGVESTGITELGSSSYSVPFSVGLGVRLYLSPRLSIGTGLNYSYLSRSFTGKYVNNSVSEAGSVTHTVQYIGLPVNVYFDIFNFKKIIFYVYGGGEMDHCISNKYLLHSTPVIIVNAPVKTVQLSANLGLGVEFALNDYLGVYLDPNLKYYFPSDQPKSIRTERPLMVNFDAGLRFNF